ncbi:MAG TPA: 16S rRNA (cytidine(1402)-2'-O)-methyltransferase [Alphaproteobacteria bacterium]|nr:16S rRNA (cytidine(1402)-2'-O)-methyltransferase [Alphaproteobacteria bacterium]
MRRADDPNERSPSSKRGEAAGTALAAGLYIVATPIGNLGDISRRAVTVLSQADLIAAEDTRTTRRLLSAVGAAAPRIVRYDDHAGDAERRKLIEALKNGKSVALVSDAGMPLIADPGLKLVRAAQGAGVKVTVVPGPSAALAALALSGLPSDRFLFQGFLPAKQGARRAALAELASIPATLIFFESPHRLAASLADMALALGGRAAAVVREITKLFEDVRRGPLAELAAAFRESGPPKGEIVIVVGPPEADAAALAEADVEAELTAALSRMSVRDAVAAVAAATGRRRSQVYALALRLNGRTARGRD